jgi:hypothetical protein
MELQLSDLITKLDQIFKHTTPNQDIRDWMIADEWEALLEELDSFRDWYATNAALANYINDPVSKRERVYVEHAKLIGTLEVENWELRRKIEEMEKTKELKKP